MADPRLKRKFTTRDAYNLVMRQTQEAREDARAWKVALGLADLMGGSNYRGSSAQARNNAMGERAQKLVSGSSSGAASRHKMLIDADKEELVAMFNEKFNKELPGFKSIMDFNSWVNKVDVEGWYPSELRSKHSTIVRNALTGRSKKATEDATMSFVDKHGANWLTNDYDTQQKIRAELFAATEGDPQGSIKRKAIMDSLTGSLPAQGQFTVIDQKIQEDKWTAEQKKTKADELEVSLQKSRDNVADDIVADATDCVLAGDGSEKAREACLQKAKDEQSKTYKNIVEQISEDVRKKFDAESPKPTKLQTKDYWDPKLREYVVATAEEAEEEGLQPTQMGALAKPEAADDLQTLVALEMIRDPNSGFTADMWHYYNEDMRRVNTVMRDRPQDVEGVVKWLLEVEARKKKSATLGIDFSVIQGKEGSGKIISVNPTD